ncbi:hypothetical protein [Exiguobacterium sp. RIT341]|uniref:hypothetical protein n=1 Tax=Exiguobacterium sp. RIT341 TaxID=1470592 RepID=UPI00044DA75C|nr:hypothetical protein [Exiguobacterium sp. RIT341]EZP61269.1 hypothetical protein BW42_00940 [Exiguobacterium sp. RIT341]
MVQSLLLIILCFFALIGHYLTTGELAPRELYGLLGLTGVAFLIGGVEWWQIRRDLRYRGREAGVSVRLADRATQKTNTVFLAHEQWLTFSRRYATWWQAILVRFKKFESFFLDVTFDGEGTRLQIKETRTEWLRNTTHFVIRKDGRDIGTIRTDPALRQQMRLQEVLLVSYAGQEYQIRSSTVTRKIGVYQNEDCIATSSRHGAQLDFDCDTNKRLFAVASMIVFRLVYSK